MDANFGVIMKKTRTEARPLVSVSAASRTSQRGQMDLYSSGIFVAGEPLFVTVQDYVVDQTAPAKITSHSPIFHMALSSDNDNTLMEHVNVIASTSNGDREVRRHSRSFMPNNIEVCLAKPDSQQSLLTGVLHTCACLRSLEILFTCADNCVEHVRQPWCLHWSNRNFPKTFLASADS